MIKKTALIAAMFATSIGIPSSTYGYEFPTNMEVTIEKGTEPLYKSESSVVFPVESYFSVTMPNGDTNFVLEHNGSGAVSLVAEGDRYRIQTPVALGDEFFFAPDPATTVQPIRLMLSGPITIGHVHFTPGSAKLTDAGRIVLSEVAHQMKMSGLMGAYLVGNTDRSGSADMNLALSEKRAAKAAKYLNRALNNLGVVGANVTYESMGEYLSDSRDGVVDEFDRKVSIMIHPGL